MLRCAVKIKAHPIWGTNVTLPPLWVVVPLHLMAVNQGGLVIELRGIT